MPHNTLFNFIKTHRINPATLFSRGVKIVFDTNKEGHPYFRFDLEPVGTSALRDDKHIYTLRDHHISVYETEHSYIPELSQYHYTAYFQDNEETQYQLHVYFNYKDEIVAEPVFAKISSAGSSIRVPAEHFHDQFIDLATYTSKSVIGLLRNQLDINVQARILKCRALEQEACELSTAIDEYYDAYVAKLEELCEELHNLVPLVRHEHHQKSERFIQQMIVALQHRGVTVPATTEVSVESPTEERDAGIVAAALVPSMIPGTVGIEAPKFIMLDDRIELLVARFAGLNKDDDALYAKELSGILAIVYELSLLLGEADTSASPLALNKLQRLHTDVHSAGEKLFPRLLLNEKIDVLKELPAFHYLLTDKYLILALQTRKPRLLDFVLTHGDFVINDYSITIRGKIYPSAVHYCFDCDSEATPMSECLGVLMKHNASIVVNDQRGLPIAHSILSTLNHPLRTALTTPDVKRKTLYSVPFYKRLIAALNHYLAEPLLETEERLAIEHEIDIYRHEIRILMLSLEGGSLRKAGAELSEKYYASFYIDQVKRDPDVMALNAMLETQSSSYLRKLSRSERRIFEHQCAAVLKDIDAFLDGKDISSLTYNDVKRSACEYLLKATDVYQKRDRLFDVQQELKKPRFTISRRTKQLVEEEKQLVRDLKILIQEMTPGDESEADDDDEFAKLLKTFNEGIAGLTECGKYFDDFRRELASLGDDELEEDLSEVTAATECKGAVVHGGLRTLGMFAPPVLTTAVDDDVDDEHKSTLAAPQ